MLFNILYNSRSNLSSAGFRAKRKEILEPNIADKLLKSEQNRKINPGKKTSTLKMKRYGVNVRETALQPHNKTYCEQNSQRIPPLPYHLS